MASSVYVHIPFCLDICSYCDFCKVYYDSKYMKNYLDALEIEIKQRYHYEKIKTLYIGGGTPSSLSLEELKRLFEVISIFELEKEYEFTFEINIESINEEKLRFLFSKGVNRLSFGVQTMDSKYLSVLNRHHTDKEVEEKIHLSKKIGFSNINVDFMYGFYNQTVKDVIMDLTKIFNLGVEHVSCYSLIIEEHTKLYIENYQKADEDTEYLMYNKINELMKQYGFSHYEFSNYAKKNYESKHNLVYWNNEEYYGFGLGAVSYLDKKRITNTRNLIKYLKRDFSSWIENVSLEEQMENEMILGLRKIKGVSLQNFKEKYHQSILETFDLKDLLSENKLVIKNGYLSIGEDYLYVSNEILVRFIK